VLVWSERKRFFAFWLAEYLRLEAILVKGTKEILAVMIVVFEELVMTVVLLQLKLTLG
jgi:hypothetical protein